MKQEITIYAISDSLGGTDFRNAQIDFINE